MEPYNGEHVWLLDPTRLPKVIESFFLTLGLRFGSNPRHQSLLFRASTDLQTRLKSGSNYGPLRVLSVPLAWLSVPLFFNHLLVVAFPFTAVTRLTEP